MLASDEGGGARTGLDGAEEPSSGDGRAGVSGTGDDEDSLDSAFRRCSCAILVWEYAGSGGKITSLSNVSAGAAIVLTRWAFGWFAGSGGKMISE